MEVVIWIIWFQCFVFWIICTLFHFWDDFQIQIWMQLFFLCPSPCMVLRFDFSIIESSSCCTSACTDVHPCILFNCQTLANAIFSFFSNILKLSWKFQEILTFLKISQIHLPYFSYTFVLLCIYIWLTFHIHLVYFSYMWLTFS